MLKKGFTISELLITLGIIGVIAAICAPALVGMIPDKRKVLYLKAYQNLAKVTDELLDSSSLYGTVHNDEGDVIYYGLNNQNKPLEGDTEISTDYGKQEISGDAKYPSLVAQRMNLAGKLYKTSATRGVQAADSGSYGFTTTDGIDWAFADMDGHAEQSNDIEQTVYININPSDSSNSCTYSANCTTPDIFIFKVDINGHVTPADIMGMVYAQDQTNMSTASKDKELAASVLSKSGSSSEYEEQQKILQKIIAEQNKD